MNLAVNILSVKSNSIYLFIYIYIYRESPYIVTGITTKLILRLKLRLMTKTQLFNEIKLEKMTKEDGP